PTLHSPHFPYTTLFRSTEKIMRYIRTRPGGDYTQATVQADVSRLAETRMFKSVRVKDARLGDGRFQVFFEVQEYPNLIREIIYKDRKSTRLNSSHQIIS